jgi:hypothetical protein
MKHRSLRNRRNDDGATLIIVLIVITAMSLAMGALLTQVDTSVQATVALQDQAATNYGADAAAQAVVTQLQNGSFGCTTPATATMHLGSGSSNPFYSATGSSSGPQNATATCTPDTVTGVTATVTGANALVGPANTPTNALTTVGSSVLDGILAGGLNYMCIQGSVVSYTSITATMSVGTNAQNSATACPNTQNAAVTVRAYGNPIPVIPGCLGSFLLTPCKPLGTSTPTIPQVPDPGYAITTANTNPAATCQSSGGKLYAAFLPGLYNRVTSTTAFSLTTPCKVSGTWVKADVDWFSPGVYYFDFGATSWKLPAAVVGGTPTNSAGQPIAGLDPTVATTLPALSQMPTGEGKCVSPTKQVQAGAGGVEFVFGGASTMTGMTPPSLFGVATGLSTDMDLCATYSATSPPVAIYGAQHTLTEGGTTVSAESGCVATPGCTGDTRSLINASSPVADQTFHIDGYVWAPAALIAMSYLHSSGQAFNWGVLARSFQLIDLGLFGIVSSPLTMVNLPDADPGPVTTYTYSIRYVNVWTCAAAATACPQTGPPNVQIKLQNTGTTWKVLSWTA